MSEPASFTACVRMTPHAFATLMRRKTLDPLAQAIAVNVTQGVNARVVFTYLKPEGALFVYIECPYPEPLDALLARPEIDAVLQAGRAKDVVGTDYAVVSHDANHFTTSAPSAVFAIDPGVWRRQAALDAAVMAQFDAWQVKHVFAAIDGGRRDPGCGFAGAGLLEPRLRRKVERALTARRARLAREQIPTATPRDPVRLFDGYHDMGSFVVWRDAGSLVPLPGVDPYTLVPTRYGAADATHVIVNGRVIRTDPARFTVLGTDAARFYGCAEGVYNRFWARIEGADSGTFSVHGGYGRDQYRWYDRDGRPLEDVGESARIDDRPHFLPGVLLLGDRSVYMGDTRLPVDAASCEVIRAQPLRRDPWFGALVWLRDVQGEHIVTRWWRAGDEATPVVSPTADPQAGWARAEAQWLAQPITADPVDALRALLAQTPDEAADAAAFLDAFPIWAGEHLDAVWREDPYNTVLWQAVERYLQGLGQRGEPARALAFFETVESEAWRWPGVFVHTAMACLALGQVQAALTHARQAARTSLHAASRLLALPAMAALLEREDAADLKGFAVYLAANPGGKPALPGELALHWLDGITQAHKPVALQHLFAHFEIPSMAQLQALQAQDADWAAHCEAAYVRMLNTSLADARTRAPAAYDARRRYGVWGELAGLSPVVHLAAAVSLYAEGLLWVDQGVPAAREAFVLAETALRRAVRLGAAPPWHADEGWRRLSNDPAYAPFVALVAEPIA